MSFIIRVPRSNLVALARLEFFIKCSHALYVLFFGLGTCRRLRVQSFQLCCCRSIRGAGNTARRAPVLSWCAGEMNNKNWVAKLIFLNKKNTQILVTKNDRFSWQKILDSCQLNLICWASQIKFFEQKLVQNSSPDSDTDFKPRKWAACAPWYTIYSTCAQWWPFSGLEICVGIWAWILYQLLFKNLSSAGQKNWIRLAK